MLSGKAIGERVAARPSVALFLSSPLDLDAALQRLLGLLVADQCVVTALALLAGNAPLVSDLRQLSRALVSPAEQVGKQIEGVAGCRASGRSGGTSSVGNDCCDLPTQAVSNTIGNSSITTCLITLFRSIGCNLLLSRQPAAEFIAFRAQITDLLRLIGDRGGLVRITVPLEIPTRRTGDDAGDDEQPDTRVDPRHATTSPPAARYAACKCSILFSC